jgi:hypothetical protein
LLTVASALAQLGRPIGVFSDQAQADAVAYAVRALALEASIQTAEARCPSAHKLSVGAHRSTTNRIAAPS